MRMDLHLFVWIGCCARQVSRRWVTVSASALLLGMGIASLGCAVREGGAAIDQPSPAEGSTHATSPMWQLWGNSPISWHAWGTEAFELAIAENKPIFLVVSSAESAASCQAERSRFHESAMASFVNQNFICMQVDSNERPDIAEYYATSFQVIQQSSTNPTHSECTANEEPLILFLTPQGQLFGGVDSLSALGAANRNDRESSLSAPAADFEVGRDTSHSFPATAEETIQSWATNESHIRESATSIATETNRLLEPRFNLARHEVNAGFVDQVTKALCDDFNSIESETRQKSPLESSANHPNGTRVIVHESLFIDQPQGVSGERFDWVLQRLACSEVYDHVGGGFFRSKRNGQEPHVTGQKHLADQAQLAVLFARAFRRTQQPGYGRVARDTIEFVLRELVHPEGAFYASTSTTGGTYDCCWTKVELEEFLTPSVSRQFLKSYRLTGDEGIDLEQKGHLAIPSQDAASWYAVLNDQSLNNVKAKLRQKRSDRVTAIRNEQVVASLNGQMIRALVECADLLDWPDLYYSAERAASCVLANLRRTDGRLVHLSYRTTTSGPAYANDYASLIDGLVALYQATSAEKWRVCARRLADELQASCRCTTGGFYLTSVDQPVMALRIQAFDKGRGADANMQAAVALARLYSITQDSVHARLALGTIQAALPALQKNWSAGGPLAIALKELIEAKFPFDLSSGRDVESADSKFAAAVSVVEGEQTIVQATAQQPAESVPPAVKKPAVVKARAYLPVDRLPAGETVELVIMLDIQKGWHISANPPQPEEMLATTVTLTGKLGSTFEKVQYPKGVDLEIDGFDEPVSSYEGQVKIKASVKVPADAAEKLETLDLVIKYQPCTEGRCLAPATAKLQAKLRVAPPGEKPQPVPENRPLFQDPEAAKPK
jgi:uncharacterized protein